LWCSHFLVPTRSDGAPTFYFSDPNVLYNVGGVQVRGSGHISLTKHHDNWGEALHGFAEDKCEVKLVADGGCDPQEVCVLKLSGETNAHVASCSQENVPFEHNFGYTLCCTPEEYCRDGIDNTGDGLIDCQSPECHPSLEFNELVPQRCDPGEYDPGNNQTTFDCVTGGYPPDPEFSAHCTYTDSLNIDYYYYCSYGEADDPSVGEGYCCPEGQYYDSELGDCRDFTKCGIDSVSLWCAFDANHNFDDWLSELFVGEPDGDGVPKWCHSHLPLFSSYGLSSGFKSEACCPVVLWGTYDYWVIDDNVKIFGYE